MNILFLTLVKIDTITENGIYQDLLRKFSREGHSVHIVCPTERRERKKTYITESGTAQILKVRMLNIQKTNLLEKGLATLLIQYNFLNAIKRFFKGVAFDLVIYSTPPITFVSVVRFIKKRDYAKSYLLLKDIFPQNAVDLGVFSENGLLYRYFKKKEKALYKISDYIGCMSQANVAYLLNNNQYLNPKKVHISPNSIELAKPCVNTEHVMKIKNKYNIPPDRKVFIYGGNLGKPQSIPFIIECLKRMVENQTCFFIICGEGTDYALLSDYFEKNHPTNLLLINGLPRKEYEELLIVGDVGLIFLDHRFSIPNFPSRLLSYMEYSMPIIACTDKNTDVGTIITENGFGWWCESNDPERFADLVGQACKANLMEMGKKSYDYLLKHYTVSQSYNTIMHCFANKSGELPLILL